MILRYFAALALPGLCLACDSADPAPDAPAEENAAPAPEEAVAAPTDPSEEQIAALVRLLAPDYADFRENFPQSQAVPAFRAAAFDLTGDGVDELLVRLEGPVDCGSGGCAFRVYRQGAAGWRKVSGTTLTYLPIGVADSASDGWRDIVVTVRGDYVEGGKVRLRYADGTYPLNPTVPPAEPAGDLGTVVLSDASRAYPLVD